MCNTATKSNEINVVENSTSITVEKEVKKKTLKEIYNEQSKNTPYIKKCLFKIDEVLNSNSLNYSDIKILNQILEELPFIEIAKNSASRKEFDISLNRLKNNKDKLSRNINILFDDFTTMKSKKSVEKVISYKSSYNIHKKKSYCVNYFKNIQVKETDEQTNMICQTIITRLQDSNDFTSIIFTNIKKRHMTEEEVIKFAHNLLKDYNQVSSNVLLSIAGNKKDMTKVINKTIDENINMDVVKTVSIPFIGSGSEYTNILPEIEEKNIKVIFNAYEKTPYQLYIDIRDNRKDLISEIKLIEIDQVKFTKNSHTNREKYRKFSKLKLEELNKLESEGKRGVRTSALLVFLSQKGFGGNLEWVDGKTKLSFPLDIKKSTRSVSSKVEFFGHLMDKCDITIENESFEVIMDKYDSKNTLFLLDPQYVKENSDKLISTATTYGNHKFPHRLCIDRTIELKGQFLYHNYKNHKLMEVMDKEHIDYVEHKKFIKNGKVENGTFKTCVELIYFSKKENFSFVSLNIKNYEPQKMVS